MKRPTELWRWGAAALVISALVALGAVAITVANRPSPNSSGGAELPDPRDPRLSLTVDAERKHRAAQITSTFENSTLELQYDYVENIGDGRGITAGRAGFTSATGDLLLLIRRYTEAKPGNVLAPYIPSLEAVRGTGSQMGLGGFTEAWAEAAEDPYFRSLQDQLVDELYFVPAMAMAADLGIETPLGQLIMWDTMRFSHQESAPSCRGQPAPLVRASASRQRLRARLRGASSREATLDTSLAQGPDLQRCLA
jgi:chitosanase